MINIILFCVLAVVVGMAVGMTIRKLRKGGGCCQEHESVASIRAADRKKAHYPYRVQLEIGGMTCGNCAVRVANALNALEDTLAKVSYETKNAEVYCKQIPDETILRKAVMDAGYVVMKYEAVTHTAV